MLRWKARSRLFPPPGLHLPDWMGGYAAAPFAVDIGAGRARVLFSGRDGGNRGHVGACTVDLDAAVVDPASITAEPLLEPGPLGAFDESGCTVSCVVRDGDRWLLYYTGWMLGRTVPFYLAVGLALSVDGGRTFHKHSAAPLFDRNDVDPLLTASPAVLVDGNVWRMWYVSALDWESRTDGPRHRYVIKYGESADGIRWKRDGTLAVPFAEAGEYAMGRPHVVKDGGAYRMWFCVRGDRYRLAYAESPDGLVWTRRAEVPPAPSDWDSAMQAYPMVLRRGSGWVMFYNGNGYGATGFGLAVAEEDGA